MGKILCFVPDRFADFEVTLALHLLNGKGGRETVTVGYSREPVTGQSGMRYTAELTLDEAAGLEDIEAFVMPGGPLCEGNEELHSLIRKLDRQNVLLAAICFAPQYLARSGVLSAHRYTTSCTPARVRALGVEDPFPRENYVDERVVTDGNVITAQGRAFVDFAFAIARYLGDCAGDEAGYRTYYEDIMHR